MAGGVCVGCGTAPVFLNSLISAGVMGLHDLPLRILAMLSPSVMYSSESGRLGGDTLRSCSGQQHPACSQRLSGACCKSSAWLHWCFTPAAHGSSRSAKESLHYAPGRLLGRARTLHNALN